MKIENRILLSAMITQRIKSMATADSQKLFQPIEKGIILRKEGVGITQDGQPHVMLGTLHHERQIVVRKADRMREIAIANSDENRGDVILRATGRGLLKSIASPQQPSVLQKAQ